MSWLKEILFIASLLWTLGDCSSNALRSSSTRSLAEGEMQRHVVHLLPFDIKIALDGNSSPEDVNIYVLKQIVTEWMDASFKSKSENQGLLNEGTTFDYVLLEIANRRELDEATSAPTPAPAFYKAVFRGFSVWNLQDPDTPPVDPELVELIQRATLLEYKKLLELIRQADDYAGLGKAVLDVRGEVADTSPPPANNDQPTSNDKSLEIIITIAIVVACLAFCLLMFAVIWAWRTDRAKREAYKVGRNQPGVVQDRTGSESDGIPSPQRKAAVAAANAKNHSPAPVRNQPPPAERHHQLPQEIPTQSNYPESVISESVISDDVETSFTAYYQSNMPHQQPPRNQPPAAPAHHQPPPKELNDAASMSSMDSYGYSLDGYASSLGPAQKYPGGALNMPQAPGSALGADDSDADLAPSENGDVAKY